MSKFLNERQVGFDTNHIGFPNLGDCMSLVMVDAGGLFGFHLTRGDLTNTPKFIEYIHDHRNYSGDLLHMYSACFRSRRYSAGGGLNDWKNEMTNIANKIKYKGPVSGVDLAVSGIKLKSGTPIYMEYRMNANVCSLAYKQMPKMTETTVYGKAAVDDNVRELAVDNVLKKRLNDAGRAKEWDTSNPARKISPTLAHGKTTDMDLTITKSNKGQLHTVKKLDTFTV